MGFAVIVRFEVKPGAEAAFLDLVHENARQSVAAEADCLRFDVVETSPRGICLYEIYTDRGAFDVHLATPHFKAFDAATSGLVASKEVLTGPTRENSKPAASGQAAVASN